LWFERHGDMQIIKVIKRTVRLTAIILASATIGTIINTLILPI
jgi:hypothetical protein